MAKEKPDYKILGINASSEEVVKVHHVAKQKGYKFTSDYIRELIESDAGEKIFDVDRGGNRRKEHAS